MKRSILVIEDNNALLRVYQEWLSLSGYRVHLADTSRAAEDSLDNRHYHVVIYDIETAGQQGVDFLREH